MKIKQYIKNNWIQIILWVILILFCIPYIISARYTVFWTDDFTDSKGSIRYGGGGLLRNAFVYTAVLYKAFQGSFVSLFLQTLISPLSTGGGIIELRIISIINILLFLVSLICFIREIIIEYNISAKNIVLFMICIVIPLLTYRSYAEIFYWYTGMTTYSYPLSCGLLACSIAYVLKRKAKKMSQKIILYIGGLLLLLYACGSSLQVSGVTCYILFVMIVSGLVKSIKIIENLSVVNIIKYMKNTTNFVIFFFFALLVSLVNLLAPGNFARHNARGENGKGIIKALFYSNQITWKEGMFYFASTTFIVFFAMSIIIGIVNKRKIGISNIIIGIMISLIFPIITVFPVILGYNYDYERTYFPSRVAFIFDFSLISALILCGFLIGTLIYEKIMDRNTTVIITLLSAISMIYMLNVSEPIEEYLPFMVCESVVTNDIQECADRITNAYKAVEESEETDVAVLYPEEAIEWFSVVTLSDSPSDWYNETLANYYGKNSVAFYRVID